MGLCLCTAFCRAVGYSLAFGVDCRFLCLRAIVEKGADPVASEDLDIEAHTFIYCSSSVRHGQTAHFVIEFKMFFDSTSIPSV